MVIRLTNSKVEIEQQNRITDIVAAKNRPGIRKSIQAVTKAYLKQYKIDQSFDRDILVDHTINITDKLNVLYLTAIDASEKRMVNMFKKSSDLIMETKQTDLTLTDNQLTDVENEMDRQKTEYIALLLLLLVPKIVKTTEKNLREYTKRGNELGLKDDELTDYIDDKMDNTAKNRSNVISDDNSHRGVVWGGLAAIGAIAAIKGIAKLLEKEWLTKLDAKVRESHVIAHGQTRPKDQKFNVGGEGLEYPKDPSGSPENIIECRCVLGYLINK